MAISTKWDSFSLNQLESVADTGDCDAQFALANSLIQRFASKKGTPKDAITAAQWYRRAAEQDHCNAQYRLGLAYAKGEGVVEDSTEAARWYLKAASQGNAWAVYRLGECYMLGCGVIQDRTKATECFEQAAAQGVDAAQSLLKTMRAQDEPACDIPPVSQDLPQEKLPTPVLNLEVGIFGILPEEKWLVASIPELEQAAQNGIPEAQYELGWLHQMGVRDMPQNFEIALGWYRKAAEQGLVKAQKRMGSMLTSGISLPQNLAEAAKWFGKAAEQGDIGTQAAIAALGVRAIEQPAPLTTEPRSATVLSVSQPAAPIHPLPIDPPPQLQRSFQPSSPARSEPLRNRSGVKIFYTVGMVAVGISLLILTKGNVLGAALVAFAILISVGLLWGGGEAIAEHLFGRHIGTGEKLVGVGILIFLLFILDKGCRHDRDADTFDPTEYRMHP